jgi:hypothetical protein
VAESAEQVRFVDAETGGDLKLQLELQLDTADFTLLRPFRYTDPRHAEPFIVPADVKTFHTDLASIPNFFLWLVPTGPATLPAFILHDGLVLEEGEAKSHIGPDVSREEADRILRDGLANLGTPLIRRWLIWTAVTIGTAFKALRPRWYWPPLVVATVVTIAVLGIIATLDVLDVWDVLPWMGHRSTGAELLGGAIFAVVIPLGLCVLWWRFWKAGAIVGVALAFLLHVTLAVVLVYWMYQLAERVSSAREGKSPSIDRNLEKATSSS